MNIGVIVGRFQVPYLTLGHQDLIKFSFGKFDKLIIFIGETKDLSRSFHDPLPYEARRIMVNNFIQENLEKETSKKLIGIFEIKDLGDYPKWVKQLDERIECIGKLHYYPIEEADNFYYIVGSRDSIVQRYLENGGKFIPFEFENNTFSGSDSGSEYRNIVCNKYKINWTEDIRKFLVWWYGTDEGKNIR